MENLLKFLIILYKITTSNATSNEMDVRQDFNDSRQCWVMYWYSFIINIKMGTNGNLVFRTDDTGLISV